MLIVTKNNYTKNISSNKELDMNSNRFSDKKLEEIKIDSNEKEIINKMLHVWNKVFESSVNPIKAYSSQKNQQTLLHLYKTAFNNDLDNWREYALAVNSSQFLMGEKETKNNFKAVFSWLIKEETIEKISNGEYGVGDRELDMDNVFKNMEEKKEEMVNKLDKKISEFLVNKVEEKKENEGFKRYVKSKEYENDGDKYNLSKTLRFIPEYGLFHMDEYKATRDNLYQSYLMKKYFDMTRIEARREIRERINKVGCSKNIGIDLSSKKNDMVLTFLAQLRF